MRYIFLVVFSFLLLGYSANALDSVEKEIILERNQTMLDRNPKYIWGADDPDFSKPKDCSGAMAKIYEKAIPIKRCRAKDMWEGKYGWEGDITFFEDGQSCDLAFFDTKGAEEVTHTGLLERNTVSGKINLLCHASKKSGYIRIPIEKLGSDYFYKRLYGIRRLK